MSISYYDFKNLSKELQHALVLAEGKLLSETVKEALKFVLYEVYCFSVEVVYNVADQKVAALNVFPSNSHIKNR
ncbi:hypothetical protein [Chryseobacterium sp. NKUCC03_KSP]|uniref:hypothetical protein n=1 Tax=Chryseobacterium sp. NKUCC03_KSP TaxID=2842125 RepID=UPI001C5AA854|nr:hypothetical protein [Chryseobacterium sp. NKUCC03_KSP]MBW3524703.1 hypothetical protein [Chryseobacterium sp. NKUCC03_KSP]